MRTSQAAARTYGIVLFVTLLLLAVQALAQREDTFDLQCERTTRETVTLFITWLSEAGIETTHLAIKGESGTWRNFRVRGVPNLYDATVRPQQEYQVRVRFLTLDDGWTDWSEIVECAAEPTPQPANTLNPVFMLHVGDVEIPLVAVALGPFDSDLPDQTLEEMLEEALKELPDPCPDGSTWRVYSNQFAVLEEFHRRLQEGAVPDDPIGIRPLDSVVSDTTRVNYFGVTPIRYEPISLDFQNSGEEDTLTLGVMEFALEWCESE